MRTVEVWCTDKGAHGRLALGVIEERGGELQPRRLKDAPAPWPTAASLVHEDGVDAMPATSTKMTMIVRADYDGRPRWAFTCPKCVPTGRQGRLMTGENFSLLFEQLTKLGQRGFDVSLLPR